ncbi:dihydrofolate reductase [uncultured Akkermansia sp.]|uniref:dihydrofolate reductase n=1 Tax=uncultured Akkermansia sp. TaxID=512294 RepID=UPI0025EAB969|nr:dihydrofolate reductase [uncultured Akkermansia sp.]
MSQPVTYTGVVSMASDRGIGYRGALPWHLPDDLKTFKRLTTGHPVLMGRKTYESIGRPLPGRQNIVLTRDPFWTAEGVDVIHSVEELERLSLMDPEVMVIGGAEIFSLMMPLMSRMWISHVREEYPADTWLPPFEDRFPSANLQEQFEGFDLFLHE